MESSKVKLNQIYNLVTQLLINYNQLLKSVQNKSKPITVYSKTGNEKFTSVDWSVQKMFHNHFQQHFPYIKFIGEENLNECPVENDYWEYNHIIDSVKISHFNEDLFEDKIYNQSDLCIYFDPIDGTTSLINGNYDKVTLLFGVTYKGSPLFGFVHFFHFEIEETISKHPICFISIPSKGVISLSFITEPELTEKSTNDNNNSDYKHIRLLSESVVPPTNNNFTFAITSSREHPTMTKIFSFFPNCEIYRKSGLGYKCILSILKNAIYFAPSKGLGFWDVCAGHALFKELGGDCWYLDSGETLVYPENSENVNLPKSVCIGLNKVMMKEFVDKVKENNIVL